MPLSKLPRELVRTIGDNMPIATLSRFLRTCHSLHELLSPAFIARITTEKLSFTVLTRGIELGYLSTVRLALDHDAPWHLGGDSPGCYNTFEAACNRCSNRFEDACNRCYNPFGDVCYRCYKVFGDVCNHAFQDLPLDIVDAMIKHYGLAVFTADAEPGSGCHHFDPLTRATRDNNLALVTLLLEAGASPDRREQLGTCKCPLDFAGKHGSAESAELLIKHGARVSGRSLSYAMNYRNWDVAAMFVRDMEMVWLQGFPWSRSFPLGERTLEDIKAWVDGGKVYLDKRVEEKVSWKIPKREMWLKKKNAYAEAYAEAEAEAAAYEKRVKEAVEEVA